MKQEAVIASFTGRWAFLSNFYTCRLEYQGRVWPTAEHAFQAMKTTNFDYQETIRLFCDNPAKAKRDGRKLPLHPHWEDAKIAIMHEVLQAKFRDKALAHLLLQTKRAELIEGNDWGDRFWGVDGGEGQNWLGRLLMLVRSELRNKKEE